MEDKSSEKPSLVICQEHKDEKGENFCWKRESLKRDHESAFRRKVNKVPQ